MTLILPNKMFCSCRQKKLEMIMLFLAYIFFAFVNVLSFSVTAVTMFHCIVKQTIH